MISNWNARQNTYFFFYLIVIFNLKSKITSSISTAVNVVFFSSSFFAFIADATHNVRKYENSKRHECYKLHKWMDGSNPMPYNEFDIIYQVVKRGNKLHRRKLTIHHWKTSATATWWWRRWKISKVAS